MIAVTYFLGVFPELVRIKKSNLVRVQSEEGVRILGSVQKTSLITRKCILMDPYEDMTGTLNVLK